MYSTLNINKKATKAEIKKAYRNKAKTCHPDVAKDKKDEFSLISQAYNILMDDEKRQRYDNGEKVDDILKPSQDQSVSIINKIFSEVLASENVNVQTQNIILTIKLNIEKFIGEADKEIGKQTKQKDKFKIFLKNLKHKKKRNTILYQLAQSSIDNIITRIKRIKKDRLALEKAYKLIKEYDYNYDDVQERVNLGTFTSTTSTML